ncbi:hypothetical protein WG66_001778 [Moniliophthora roreri]|nr:hypothetical protein WG66_001778 [Moniliophthora roreri]
MVQRATLQLETLRQQASSAQRSRYRYHNKVQVFKARKKRLEFEFVGKGTSHELQEARRLAKPEARTKVDSPGRKVRRELLLATGETANAPQTVSHTLAKTGTGNDGRTVLKEYQSELTTQVPAKRRRMD